jgi:signal transduction histidine kinase
MVKKNNCKINFILIFLFSGFAGWTIKSVLDSLILFDKPFFDIFIFNLSTGEFIIRMIVSICFSIAGILFYKNYQLRKKAQYELKKTKDKLEELNKNLNSKVDQKTQDVEKLLRDKTKLIIGLSHDLRTPLTPCMGIILLIFKK